MFPSQHLYWCYIEETFEHEDYESGITLSLGVENRPGPFQVNCHINVLEGILNQGLDIDKAEGQFTNMEYSHLFRLMDYLDIETALRVLAATKAGSFWCFDMQPSMLAKNTITLTTIEEYTQYERVYLLTTQQLTEAIIIGKTRDIFRVVFLLR